MLSAHGHAGLIFAQMRIEMLWFNVDLFAQAASEVYGRPEVLPRVRNADGQAVSADDFREAFAWIRTHTPAGSVVCSWWDYGYQLSALGERAVCLDNNTWNATHVGLVGLALASREERAWEILKGIGATCAAAIYRWVALRLLNNC